MGTNATSTSSDYRGVSWDKGKQRWVVKITLRGRKHFVGYFKEELEAARAYDRAATQLHQHPVLNFQLNGRLNPDRKIAHCGLTSSSYRGVYWEMDRNRWRAVIRHKRKQYKLGCFEDEVEAARAYDRAARRFHVNPTLNFPEDGSSEDEGGQQDMESLEGVDEGEGGSSLSGSTTDDPNNDQLAEDDQGDGTGGNNSGSNSLRGKKRTRMDAAGAGAAVGRPAGPPPGRKRTTNADPMAMASAPIGWPEGPMPLPPMQMHMSMQMNMHMLGGENGKLPASAAASASSVPAAGQNWGDMAAVAGGQQPAAAGPSGIVVGDGAGAGPWVGQYQGAMDATPAGSARDYYAAGANARPQTRASGRDALAELRGVIMSSWVWARPERREDYHKAAGMFFNMQQCARAQSAVRRFAEGLLLDPRCTLDLSKTEDSETVVEMFIAAYKAGQFE